MSNAELRDRPTAKMALGYCLRKLSKKLHQVILFTWECIPVCLVFDIQVSPSLSKIEVKRERATLTFMKACKICDYPSTKLGSVCGKVWWSALLMGRSLKWQWRQIIRVHNNIIDISLVQHWHSTNLKITLCPRTLITVLLVVLPTTWLPGPHVFFSPATLKSWEWLPIYGWVTKKVHASERVRSTVLRSCYHVSHTLWVGWHLMELVPYNLSSFDT